MTLRIPNWSWTRLIKAEVLEVLPALHKAFCFSTQRAPCSQLLTASSPLRSHTFIERSRIRLWSRRVHIRSHTSRSSTLAPLLDQLNEPFFQLVLLVAPSEKARNLKTAATSSLPHFKKSFPCSRMTKIYMEEWIKGWPCKKLQGISQVSSHSLETKWLIVTCLEEEISINLMEKN